MGLNIKNERVCDLARQAAAMTGTSQTSAVEAALLSYIAQHDEASDRAERARRARETVAWFDAHLTDADRAAAQQVLDEMYDEMGLPQ